jgi:hypothetical protein
VLTTSRPFQFRSQTFGSLFPSRKEDRAVLFPWAFFLWRINPRIRNIVSLTKSHYKLMNTAQASGSLDTLEQVCQTGLESKITANIRSRQRGTTFQWTLLDNNGNPTEDVGFIKAKLVSVAQYQPAEMEEVETAIATQELIVHLSGQQLLTGMSDGRVVLEEEAEIDEYVIIQRRVVNKVIDSWYLWGSGEPTTFEKWIEDKDREEKGVLELEKKKAYL